MKRLHALILVGAVAVGGCALGVQRTRYSSPAAPGGRLVAPPASSVPLGGDYQGSVSSNAPFAETFHVADSDVGVMACTLRRQGLLWFIIPPLPPLPGPPRDLLNQVPSVAMPERLTVVVSIAYGAAAWTVDPTRVRLHAGWLGAESRPVAMAVHEHWAAPLGALSAFAACEIGGASVSPVDATVVRAPATVWLSFEHGNGPGSSFELSLAGLVPNDGSAGLPTIAFSHGTYTFWGLLGP